MRSNLERLKHREVSMESRSHELFLSAITKKKFLKNVKKSFNAISL